MSLIFSAALPTGHLLMQKLDSSTSESLLGQRGAKFESEAQIGLGPGKPA